MLIDRHPQIRCRCRAFFDLDVLVAFERSSSSSDLTHAGRYEYVDYRCSTVSHTHTAA
jgi:hypothetical protein